MQLRIKKCYEISKPNAFFVDTNFLINITQDNPLVHPFLDVAIFISYISEIELLEVFRISKELRINKQNLIGRCTLIEMNLDIKKITINLKQKYKLKLADAIIAATAIHLGLPFITSDADFKSIKELELIFLEK